MTFAATFLTACGTILLFAALSFADDKPVTPDLSKFGDPKVWELINGHARTGRQDGGTVLRLDPIGGNTQGQSNIAFALVQGVAFETGVIEVDLRGSTPPDASFLGIAFNVTDEKHFEAIYFRPFNLAREGFTDHAVQYVAHPDHPWKELRDAKPGVYEAKVDPAPDPAAWFHARIEISAAKVRVTVNDAKAPCLTVERLNAPASGTVGLWVDSQSGAFRNLKIQPAPDAARDAGKK